MLQKYKHEIKPQLQLRVINVIKCDPMKRFYNLKAINGRFSILLTLYELL